MKNEVHRLGESAPLDARDESSRFHFKNLDGVSRLVRHVEMPAMDDDPAYRVPGFAVLVQYDLEALRRRHVRGCACLLYTSPSPRD